ncbi:MAG: hypothetical protein Q9221_005082 [Calogaya cf. arnoldii]
MLPSTTATRLVAILLCYLTSSAIFARATAAAEEAYPVGPYQIEQCQIKTQNVSQALIAMHKNVLQAIRYINNMTSPGADTKIYDTFFRGVPDKYVKGKLTAALRGGPTYHTRHAKTPVAFICVLYGNPAMKEISEFCKKNPAPAFHQPNSHFIFLCPATFYQPLEPEYEHCADYTRRGKRLSGGEIQSTQTMLLLHELIHLMLGEASFEHEVYPIDEVVKLNPARSAMNAANYAYFVGTSISSSTPIDYPVNQCIVATYSRSRSPVVPVAVSSSPVSRV